MAPSWDSSVWSLTPYHRPTPPPAGQVPEELRPPGAAPGDINVRLEDKSGEDYKAPPPPAYTAYSGEGQSVGGAAEVAAGALVSAGAGSGVAPVVDPAQPTTTMMIRLATGKRLKATLNLTHTVRRASQQLNRSEQSTTARAAVRSALLCLSGRFSLANTYILGHDQVGDLQALLSAEGAAAEPYVLMAGFPPAQLTDAALTIEVAGLKGAQITQKRV